MIERHDAVSSRPLRAVLLFAVIAWLAIVGCQHDLPTAPSTLDTTAPTEVGPPDVGPIPASAVMPPNAADVITFSIGPGPSGQAASPLFNVYTAPTADLLTYEAKASGVLNGFWLVQATGFIAPLSPGGARNRDGTCSGYLVRASSTALNGTGAGFPCGDESDTVASLSRVTFKDSLRFGRAAGGNPGPLWVDGQKVCGGYDCLAYAGSQTVTLERVKGKIDGQIDRYGSTAPASTARYGQTVTAKSWVSYAGTPVNWLSYRILEWAFTPEASTVPNRYTTCTTYGAQCSWIAKNSGTMTVTGYVNGEGLDKAMPLRVIRRLLQLEVTPGAAVRRGTIMNFRMFPDTAGGAAWSGVTWRISDSTAVSGSTCGAGKTTCSETALKSYQRTAIAVVDDSLQEKTQGVTVYSKFEIIPDKTTPKLGDTVVFTAYLDDVVHPIPRWEWDGAARPSCSGSAICVQVMDTVGAVKMVGWTLAAGGDSAFALVSPSAPALRVTAQPGAVNRGEVVAFGFAVDGIAEAAQSWSFLPDTSSGDRVACPSNSTGCEKIMQVGGTMRALWHKYRHRDSAEVHITVEGACPTTQASAVVAAGWVGTPCGSSGPSDTTGGGPRSKPQYTLTVHRSNGVQGTPLPSDTSGIFVFDSGTVVGYQYEAAASSAGVFRDLLVFVDDTLISADSGATRVSGSLMLDRNREVILEASWYPEPSTTTANYKTRLATILANPSPAAYASLIAAVGRDFKIRGEAAIADLEFAIELAINPTRDAQALMVVDQALAGTEYAVWHDALEELQVAVVPSGGTGALLAAIVDSAGHGAPVALTFVNGISTSKDETESAVSSLGRVIAGRGLITGDTVALIYNPTSTSAYRTDSAYARMRCVESLPRLSVLESIRAQAMRMRRCMQASFVQANVARASEAIAELGSVARDWLDLKRTEATAPVNGDVVNRIRARMLAHRAAGTHSIWVGHSRGNLAILRAANDSTVVPRYQRTSCVALLSLAPPLDASDFGAFGPLWDGFTVRGDMLWQAFLTNVRTIVTPDAELPRTAWPVTRNLAAAAGLSLHYTAQYFNTEIGSNSVRASLSTLRDKCLALPP